MYFLETKNIRKTYADHVALDDVSVRIPTGKVYGLLGPNGAGKTTLIRIINRITAPDQGTVLWENRPMTIQDTSCIGYLPEERGLYKKMKVGEQSLYLARLKGLSKQDAQKRLNYWFEKFDIASWKDKKLEELSKGMAQKVQFIITILHEPKLLIFDEPFSGFDPLNTQLLKDEILTLKEKGATVIFSTHNMASVEEICDEISLINHSKVVLEGNVDDIRKQYAKGVFVIKTAQNPKEQSQDSPYSILNTKQQNQYWVTRIQNNASITTKALLEQLNQQFEMLAFEEEIPSMNDIFIQTVKK
jgi:ABC-2 type transport system ATP-binding protein